MRITYTHDPAPNLSANKPFSSTLYKIPREFGFVGGADMRRPARNSAFGALIFHHLTGGIQFATVACARPER